MESELSTMDLIVVMLEVLDQVFPKCRELDIKLNPEKVHILTDLVICNGTVINTNTDEIMDRFKQMTAQPPSMISSGLSKLGSIPIPSFFKFK